MNQHFKRFRPILICLFIMQCMFETRAQSRHSFIGGIDVNWYPAGWIIAPSIGLAFKENQSVNFRLGYNRANRYNWSGLNDDETGGGLGCGLGYRYVFPGKIEGLYVNAKIDLWQMNIHWKNEIGQANETSGMTKTTVLQPMLELGYRVKIKERYHLGLMGGFGQEINIKTQGKPVGEGGMWLLGCNAWYRW